MNLATEVTVISIKATELHRNYVTAYHNFIEDEYKGYTICGFSSTAKRNHWSQDDLRVLIEMIHGDANSKDVIEFFGRRSVSSAIGSNAALSLPNFWNCVDPDGKARISMLGDPSEVEDRVRVCNKVLKNLVLVITDDAGVINYSVPGNCLQFKGVECCQEM